MEVSAFVHDIKNEAIDSDDMWSDSENSTLDDCSISSDSMWSNSVASLLQDSLTSFLEEGPVMHPLEHQYSPSGRGRRSMPFTSNSKVSHEFVMDCLSLVCECKGFEYAILWEMNNKTGLLTARTGYCIPGSGQVDNFYQCSLTLRAFPLGLELPGRVAFSGQPEWCDHVDKEVVCRFHRVHDARKYGVQTIVGIPLACGVLEFGSSEKIEKCPHILRYIHNVCNPLMYCLQQNW